MKKSRSSGAKSPAAPAGPPPTPELAGLRDAALEPLLRRLGIDDWDFLLVGDGSGSDWSREAGWGAVSIERATGEALAWYGGVNRGTVNVAEVMAYLIPLNWLAAREADRRRAPGGRARACRVHIVTDSEYARDTGSSPHRSVVKNAGLWAAFSVFARQGILLHWHWIPRDSDDLNRHADALSKAARRLVKQHNTH